MGRLTGEVAIVTGAVDVVLTHFVKNVPLGRVASVDEIGDLADFLASGESKYITGQEIVIDGGNLIQRKKGDF